MSGSSLQTHTHSPPPSSPSLYLPSVPPVTARWRHPRLVAGHVTARPGACADVVLCHTYAEKCRLLVKRKAGNPLIEGTALLGLWPTLWTVFLKAHWLILVDSEGNYSPICCCPPQLPHPHPHLYSFREPLNFI